MTRPVALINRLVDAEVKRRKRRKVVRVVILGFIKSFLYGLINGWLLMLAAGVAHAWWLVSMPTMGYWCAVLLVILLRGVFAPPPSTTKEKP